MLTYSKLLERIKYFLFEVENDWEIGIASASVESIFFMGKLPEIKWLKMPQNVFWADPFGVELNNNYHIFYEEFQKDKGYATINCMILDSGLKELQRKVIIDKGSHLSYPYIFSYAGHYYMLPESCIAGKLMLFKATSFPFEWKEESILLHIPCVDSILFHAKDYWWLLYSKGMTDNCNSNLYVRKNSNPITGWDNCSELAIHSTAYNTRNGGVVFASDSELYRITQNCTERYGQSVVINKITTLSDHNFAETPAKEILLKQRGVTGFHTLSPLGKYALVDRRRERLFFKSPLKMIHSIRRKAVQ